MCIVSNKNVEHCIDGVVVSQKVIKLFGLPIYIKTMETSNYNYVGQFDINNFVKEGQEEIQSSGIYTETNIGFNRDEEKATIQSKRISKKG